MTTANAFGWTVIVVLLTSIVACDCSSGTLATGRSAGDDDLSPDDDDDNDDNDDSAAAGLAWITIPSGSFEMGCVPDDQICLYSEKPRHEVTISAAFQLTKSDITQKQYQIVTGTDPAWFQPPNFPPCPDCPVETVSWFDAYDYCAAVGGRLPTEAEWEYAARAGTTTIYICGDDPSCIDSIAWHAADSGRTIHPVCQKTPNAWGLCDMAGDVWQWVEDWYSNDYYAESPPNDPPGPASGEVRTLRGGSWASDGPTALRASSRLPSLPQPADYFGYGFRCARDDPGGDDDNDASPAQ